MNQISPQNSSQNPVFFHLKVLVADPDQLRAKETRKKIEKAGHSVLIAGKCSEIITNISKTFFNLILLNINFPDCDAIELIEDIRGISPHINVVAIAKESSVEIEKRTRKKRVMCYLIHPIEQEELESILGHITKRELKLK